jgi:hypothetical protein
MPQGQKMTVRHDFESANTAFYRAFATADFAAMSRLWAESLSVSCCHPGADPLLGRTEILNSWRQIFLHGQPTDIRFIPQQMALTGGIGIACGLEVIGNGRFACTNLFAMEGGVWRMIHHQGGPVMPATMRSGARPADSAPPTRH